MPKNHNLENLIGQTFGKLTVISRHPTETKTYWNCECSCGGSKIARSDHLKKYIEKQQCDTCLKIQNLESLINKAREIYPDVYDYSKATYKDIDTGIIITCKIHGDFKKSPYNFLAGSGCPSCANAVRNYDFIDKYITNPELGSQEGILYLMKFSSENEEFLKLGITANLRKRVNAYSRTKEYTKKIIYAGKTTNLKSALIEREMLQEFQTVDTHHHPLVSFDGRTECLSVSCEDTLLDYMKSSCELIPVKLEGKFSLEF